MGIIGAFTGVTSLIVTIRKWIEEKPIIKMSDVLLQLKKQDQNKIIGMVSFNADNLCERSSTITRVNVIFGDDVEVIEGLRTILSRSIDWLIRV